MIRELLRKIGLWPYLKYFKKKYFPSASQKEEERLIPERISFYQQFIEKGDLCFDVGANIGNRTEIFLKLGARVVAIEPQKECSKLLQLRFGNEITLVQQALGSHSGDGTIFISDTAEISSLSKEWIDSVSKSRFKNSQWNKREEVKITTLDQVIEQNGYPKFCKIDVEGFEEEVLKGLSKPIPTISFEYTIPERLSSVMNCLELLSKLGYYECNYTIGETMNFESSQWLSKEKLIDEINGLSENILFGDIYLRFRQ